MSLEPLRNDETAKIGATMLLSRGKIGALFEQAKYSTPFRVKDIFVCL